MLHFPKWRGATLQAFWLFFLQNNQHSNGFARFWAALEGLLRGSHESGWPAGRTAGPAQSCGLWAELWEGQGDIIYIYIYHKCIYSNTCHTSQNHSFGDESGSRGSVWAQTQPEWILRPPGTFSNPSRPPVSPSPAPNPKKTLKFKTKWGEKSGNSPPHSDQLLFGP